MTLLPIKYKMALLSLILFILICSSWKKENPKSNYFEGTISYRISFETTNPKIDTALLLKLFGKSATLYFKEGNYLETCEGSSILTNTLYRKEDNRAYTRKAGTDTTKWDDCSLPGDSILKFEYTPKKEKILGIECDELIIYYNDRRESQYYNSDSFNINPDWFKNFVRDGENRIDQKEKAVCLKHKTEYQGFTLSLTATSFSRQPINDSIFQLLSNEVLIENKDVLSFEQRKGENLKINWPQEYDWKIASNTEDSFSNTLLIIPRNESPQKWSILGEMMSIKKNFKASNIDYVLNIFSNESLQESPKAKYEVLEKDEKSKNFWAIYKVETPDFPKDPIPESQLWYIIQGDSTLYINFVAIKEKSLSKEFTDKWTKIFKTSQLINKSQ